MSDATEPPDSPHETRAVAVPPSGIYRLRRRLRRFRNEVRAMLAERRKTPDPACDPVSVNLNCTTICNLRCTMCQQSWDDLPQEVMDHDLYARVRDGLFDRASEMSLSVMGEPFCVPREFMEEILDDVERHDLRLEITTNATRFGTDEELERVARLCHRLVISIDGATRETFEAIRKPAKWDKTVGNIDRLAAIRRRLPLRRRPLLYFSYVLMRENLEELPAFVDLARSWGAYSISASPLITVHPALEAKTIDPADPQVQSVLRRAHERARMHGIGLKIEGVDSAAIRPRRSWGPTGLVQAARQAWIPFRPALNLGVTYLLSKLVQRFRVAPRECPYLWHKVFVQIDGRVATCCHPDYLVPGDMTREPISEIWHGVRYSGIRSALNSEHPAAPCRDCHLLRR